MSVPVPLPQFSASALNHMVQSLRASAMALEMHKKLLAEGYTYIEGLDEYVKEEIL